MNLTYWHFVDGEVMDDNGAIQTIGSRRSTALLNKRDLFKKKNPILYSTAKAKPNSKGKDKK